MVTEDEPRREESATDAAERAWHLRDSDPAAARALLKSHLTDRDLTDDEDALLATAQGAVTEAFLLYREHDNGRSLTRLLEAEEVLMKRAATVWHARLSNTKALVYGRAAVATSVDQMERAIEFAEKVGAIEEQFTAHHNMALLYLNLQDHQGAERRFDQAEAFTEDLPERQGFLAHNRARLLLELGRPEDAIELLAEADRLWPEDRMQGAQLYVKAARADVAAELGRAEEATAAVAEVEDLCRRLNRRSPNATLAKARLNVVNGEPEAALALAATVDLMDCGLTVGRRITSFRTETALAIGDHRAAYQALADAKQADEQTRFLQQADSNTLVRIERAARLKRKATRLEQSNRDLGRLVSDLQRLQEQLIETSSRDALTGLFNRRQLFIEANLQAKLARRHERPLSVAMIDVDHFKAVNDQHFHSTGDAVLRAMADILTAGARESDLVGRYGGDEFVLILPEVDLEGARVLCERIRLAVEDNDWERIKPGLSITVTIGIAQASARESAEDLFHRADQRLYVAKALGRNQVAQ